MMTAAFADIHTSAAPAALPHANENVEAPTGAPALSPFATHASTMLNLGFTTIPIMDGEKRPAIHAWQVHCDRAATSEEMARYSRIPGAGIGVALGFRVGAHQIIAIDLDVEGANLDMLASALPDSPMEKRGAKGLTRYFRADPAVKTKRYRTTGGRGLADLQAHGAQTVVPPSRHPSGVDYVWTRGPARADMLPIIASSDIARFEDACAALGWEDALTATHIADCAAVAGHGAPQAHDEGSGFCRELNNLALANPASWVPYLTGLYGTRRKPDGYEGVPLFRSSGAGNPPERRKRNLSIISTGICDWGDGKKGYTPINLAIASEGIGFVEAVAWLKARVMPTIDTSGFDGITALNGASAQRATENMLPAHEPLTGEIMPAVRPATAPRTPPVVTWDDHDANAGLIFEYLIKGMFPRRGVSLLFGQSGSAKSFVSLEMGACVTTGQPFFGNRTKLTGGVLYALGEGAGTMPVRLDALRKGRFNGEAPTNPTTGEALDLDRLPIAWITVGELWKPGPFAAFAMAVRESAADMESRHGCKLRLVVVDTVVAAFGFPEDPDASDVTRAMKALDGLAQELDLCIVAVHHAGKTKEAGEHGSYAWRGSAETSINVDGKKHALLGIWEERRLIVVKNRHGVEGWNRTFDLKSVVLGEDEDGDEISSAIVVPFDPAAMDGITSGSGHGSHPAGIARVLNALIGSMASAAETINVSDDETTQAVMIDVVRSKYEATHPSDHARRNFNRDLKAAIDARLVAKRDLNGVDWLWPTASNDNNSSTE